MATNNSSEMSATLIEQEDRAQFGQLRTFTWRSFPASTTLAWVGLYFAAFFVTLSADYGINLFQKAQPAVGSVSQRVFS